MTLPNARPPSGYRLFDLHLLRRHVLSPSLVRLVFGGPEAHRVRTLAPDQRVKLLFPASDGSPAALPQAGHWLSALRSLPDAKRPPMRTYTLRDVRPDVGEVDVEFVLHGDTGPASTWANHAQPGAILQMVAPDADFPDDPGGYEWQPPKGVGHVLLMGDETALPAIVGALEQMASWPCPPQVQAFIEVPSEADCVQVRCPPDTQLVWLPRDQGDPAHGTGMRHAAWTLAHLPSSAAREQTLPEVDIERDILWERATPVETDFYAWVAGESAAVMAIRRHWVSELGLDKRALTFMGYWRLGRALD